MEIGFKFTLYVIGSFLILGTILPFIRSDHWIIRIFDFPRLQIAVFILLICSAYKVIENPRSLPEIIWISCLLGALVYQVYKIYPYTRFSQKQVISAQNDRVRASFKLLISNVYMYNDNVEKYLEIVSRVDPDIILTVETNQWWTEVLADLGKTHPFMVQHPLENTYGMLLFSRLKLIDTQVRFLVEDDVPSIRTTVEIATGEHIELYCLHPRPPRPLKNQKATERNIELIIVSEEIRNNKKPVVVAGDLNDVAWSYTTRLFQKISGLLDPRIGRGLFSTFHAKIPFLRWPLDHVFHSEHFKLINLKRLEYFGSDHFPIFIHLQLHPAAEMLQSPPAAEQEDLVEAVNILNKEG